MEEVTIIPQSIADLAELIRSDNKTTGVLISNRRKRRLLQQLVTAEEPIQWSVVTEAAYDGAQTKLDYE